MYENEKLQKLTPYHPFSHVKKRKNSNFAVFKNANNFIAGIQFLAHRLTTKKVGTPRAPRNTPKLPLFITKIPKNSNFAVFQIANNFITGIQFLAHRLATKKLGTPKAPRNALKTTLICSKNTKKILISPFLRSPIILLPEYHFQHTDYL